MKNNEKITPAEIHHFHLGFCLGGKASSLTQGIPGGGVEAMIGYGRPL